MSQLLCPSCGLSICSGVSLGRGTSQQAAESEVSISSLVRLQAWNWLEGRMAQGCEFLFPSHLLCPRAGALSSAQDA
jgi:hypothetical protein